MSWDRDTLYWAEFNHGGLTFMKKRKQFSLPHAHCPPLVTKHGHRYRYTHVIKSNVWVPGMIQQWIEV